MPQVVCWRRGWVDKYFARKGFLGVKIPCCKILQGSTYSFEVVIWTHHVLESVMSERDEMRRLIDVIERGVMSASVEQNIEDMRLFANTASFIANKVDVKLKQRTQKPKARRIAPSIPKLPMPKPRDAGNKPKPTTTVKEPVTQEPSSSGTSSTNFQRLQRVQPQAPIKPVGTV